MANKSPPIYCQSCKQPIRLDGTIQGLNPAAFNVLIGSTGNSAQKPSNLSRLAYPQERKSRYDRAIQQSPSAIYKRTIPPPSDEPSSSAYRSTVHAQADMSFIEITQSQAQFPEEGPDNHSSQGTTGQNGTEGQVAEKRPPTLADELSKAEKLFTILSSHSDIDHPICSECTSLLITGLKARMNNAVKERDAYAFFLRNAQQNSLIPTSKDAQSRKSHKNDNEAMYTELQRIEQEAEQVKADTVRLNDEVKKLDLAEQAFWLSRNTLDEKLHDTSVHLSTLQQTFIHDQHRLERLQRTNVFNDTFCVGHDGSFGTINGLRLGRLPNTNVEWGEINAAWGQTLLLLATVAERLRYTFQGFRLRPQGSTSRIERLEYPQQSPDPARQTTSSRERALGSNAANPEPKVTVLDLFSSGEMAIGRVLYHRKFDNGMVAFLDCLSQVAKHVERTSVNEHSNRTSSQRPVSLRANPKQPVLPYTIENDKIGGISIKLGMGFGDAESFTRACKYVLTCCKFLLAYVSNLENQRGT